MSGGTKLTIHIKTNLQLSVASLFNCVCPVITTQHEKVKNCSNMIFSTLWVFLMALLSESINQATMKVIFEICFRTQKIWRPNFDRSAKD